MNKKCRILASCSFVVVLLLAAGLWRASDYMLSYSLCPERDTYDVRDIIARKAAEYPWQAAWLDSVRDHAVLHDLTMRSAATDTLLHAVSLPAARPTKRTALLVHGYGCCSLDMLHIAYIYHHLLGMNVVMPDLYGHGLSGGTHANMGWTDRLDVLQWAAMADSLFGDSTSMVMHGISMGGATVMMASGEEAPACVRAYIDDCGYTTVWDEFASELRERFWLPSFPLMYTTSALCRHRYGWSFQQADCLHQVRRCQLPMLFIHGDQDTFVPTRMAYELFCAKPQPKRLWISQGSKHARSYADNPEKYTREVASFVHEYLPADETVGDSVPQ